MSRSAMSCFRRDVSLSEKGRSVPPFFRKSHLGLFLTHGTVNSPWISTPDSAVSSDWENPGSSRCLVVVGSALAPNQPLLALAAAPRFPCSNDLLSPFFDKKSFILPSLQPVRPGASFKLNHPISSPPHLTASHRLRYVTSLLNSLKILQRAGSTPRTRTMIVKAMRRARPVSYSFVPLLMTARLLGVPLLLLLLGFGEVVKSLLSTSLRSLMRDRSDKVE